MKKIITCVLAALGLTVACGQEHYENTDVKGFSELLEDSNVIVLDVRTINEYTEEHIEGALNIDQSQEDFIQKANSILSKNKIIAIYCRSGRRSANAAGRLANEGYKCVNLKGGIIAWKEENKPVTNDNYEVDIFKTQSGKIVKFHPLIHASIRIEYDGYEIEIDPITKLGNKEINYKTIPKADYIFVTHEHFDHFDINTIKYLSKANTQLITNERCAKMYGSGTIMKNGDKLQLAKDIFVEAVPAYNTTEGNLQFHPKGRDNGYILTIENLRIYIAGDTEDIPEMNVIKDIDIAFLPCNQPYTMTTEQLANAALTIKPKVVFPYHYAQTDVSTLPPLLQQEFIEVRIRHYE